MNLNDPFLRCSENRKCRTSSVHTLHLNNNVIYLQLINKIICWCSKISILVFEIKLWLNMQYAKREREREREIVRERERDGPVQI